MEYKGNYGAWPLLQEFPDEGHEGGVVEGEIAVELPLDVVVQVGDLVVFVADGLVQCNDLLPGIWIMVRWCVVDRVLGYAVK